jgi:hypothetical protein
MVTPHTEHLLPSVRPVLLQVAETAFRDVGVWDNLSTVFCSVRTSPHTEHLLPSVRPVEVQVAVTAFTAAGVWAIFSMVSCSVRTSPHTEHLLPAVRPEALQVAATDGMGVEECSVLEIGVVSFAEHTEHDRSSKPSSMQEAGFVMTQSLYSCWQTVSSGSVSSGSVETAEGVDGSAEVSAGVCSLLQEEKSMVRRKRDDNKHNRIDFIRYFLSYILKD